MQFGKMQVGLFDELSQLYWKLISVIEYSVALL